MRDPDYSILLTLRPPSPKNVPRTSLAGRRFGQLTVFGVVGYLKTAQATGYWLCVCDCGNWTIVNRNKLLRKYTRSCGCQSAVQRTHGMRHTRVYYLWTDMLTRVRNQNSKNWDNYGGRGIRACAGFQRFENFFAALGHPAKGESADRVDVDGHYSCGKCTDCTANGWPFNVRWATSKEQNRNRRDNRRVSINGLSKCLAEWSELSGVQASTAWFRLDRGWTPEQAFGFAGPPSRKRQRVG